jgi:hypothetical protein
MLAIPPPEQQVLAMPAGRITALISRFRRDTTANIAVMFAIATVPILAAAGCATTSPWRRA